MASYWNAPLQLYKSFSERRTAQATAAPRAHPSRRLGGPACRSPPQTRMLPTPLLRRGRRHQGVSPFYISNAGCKTQPFLQLYSTISKLCKLGFKETKTSRYLHLPCINMKKNQLFFCRPDDVSVSCRSTAMAGTYACHDVCVAVVDNHGPHGILRCNSLSYLLLTGNYPLVPACSSPKGCHFNECLQQYWSEKD